LFEKKPEDLKALNILGTGRHPGFAVGGIGTDTPPGEYTLTATVADRAAQTSKKISKKFEVLPKPLGLVRLQLTYPTPPELVIPAPPIGVPGQTLAVNCMVLGFERDKKTKQPHIVATMRVLEGNKPTLEKENKENTGVINEKFPEDQSLMPLTFNLSLNRPGKFTVELKVTDKHADKTVTQTFDINVSKLE